MNADLLLTNVKTATVGPEFSIRMIGSQTPPVKMSIQIAITGTAKVSIQGRLHKNAPWQQIGDLHEKSCLVYIEPIAPLRAVSSDVGEDSSVSVWAAWGM